MKFCLYFANFLYLSMYVLVSFLIFHTISIKIQNIHQYI
jgi:hypothetical protein